MYSLEYFCASFDGVILELRQYNPFGQLVYVYRTGFETRYAYRLDGLRHRKELADGSAVTHIWDDQNIVAECGKNGAVRSWYLRGITRCQQRDWNTGCRLLKMKHIHPLRYWEKIFTFIFQ